MLYIVAGIWQWITVYRSIPWLHNDDLLKNIE